MLVGLIERLDGLEPLEYDELDPGRQLIGRRPEQASVVRVRAQ